jgi:RNase P subunit RPR2
MTYAEVIRGAIPLAPDELCEHILWSRTPYPMGRVTAQDLYRAASTFRRAADHNIELCDFCDQAVVPSNRFICERCDKALHPDRAQVQASESSERSGPAEMCPKCLKKDKPAENELDGKA